MVAIFVVLGISAGVVMGHFRHNCANCGGYYVRTHHEFQKITPAGRMAGTSRSLPLWFHRIDFVIITDHSAGLRSYTTWIMKWSEAHSVKFWKSGIWCDKLKCNKAILNWVYLTFKRRLRKAVRGESGQNMPFVRIVREPSKRKWEKRCKKVRNGMSGVKQMNHNYISGNNSLRFFILHCRSYFDRRSAVRLAFSGNLFAPFCTCLLSFASYFLLSVPLVLCHQRAYINSAFDVCTLYLWIALIRGIQGPRWRQYSKYKNNPSDGE